MADKLCMGCMETYNDKYDVCPHCGYVDGTAPKEAYHLIPGTVIEGRYIVGKVIGNGGFGVTYIGYDPVLNQKIAIKEYLPGEFSTRAMGSPDVTVFSGEKEEQFASGIIKFVEEARRLAKFKHTPGIVDIHDSFQANHTAYIIMEYIDGETLKEKLEREGKISVDEALNIMMPVIGALKEVHKEGILHRDISPDNIMISKAGDVKIIDFGAARFATTTHSRSLSVLVKPGYAPEEQYRSRGDQGTWTDVYACAATLYKMITGVTPEDAMERRNKDTLLPPSKLGVKIPKNKENAIMNALNIRIEDRTQTADDLEADLFSDRDVKRNKIHLKKMDIGKWPIWLKITSGVAAAAVCVFIVLLVTGVIKFADLFHSNRGQLENGYVYAPEVVNIALAEAEKTVGDANLITQITDKQHSDEIAEDMVLQQNIPSGTVVQEKTVMELVVSAGYEKGYMPDIVGLSKDEVLKLLLDMGWDESAITFEDVKSEIAPGYVAKQDVEEGTVVKIGDKITIYLSKGVDGYDTNNNTKVPNLVKDKWSDAQSKVKEAKLYLYKSGTDYSNTVPKGCVISQNPEADTEVAEGSKVGVVISLGKQEDAMVHVPDVQYKSKSEAIALLQAQGLEVQTQNEESDSVQKDHVIRQSVAAGTEVQVGTTVVIYISLGNPNAVITYDPTTTQANVTTENSTTENSTTEKTTASTDNKPSDSSGKTTTQVTTTEAKQEEEVVNPVTTTEAPPQPDPEAGKIKVPNLVGKTEVEARKSLSDKKLSAGAVTYQHKEGATNGTVLSQGIEPDTKVAKETVVNFVVCNNETYTEYRYKSKEEKTSSEKLDGWSLVKTQDNWSNWSSETTSPPQANEYTEVKESRTETNMPDNPGNPYPIPSRTLTQATSGDDCRWVEKFIAEYMLGYNYEYMDGVYGGVEMYYVGVFQSWEGLTQDKSVGPATRDRMLQRWREKQSTTTKYYVYRTKTVTYYYEKVSGWSDWSKTKVTKGGKICDVETRTVYKY